MLECCYCSLSQADESLIYSLVAEATCQFMNNFDAWQARRTSLVMFVDIMGLTRECHVVLACFRPLDQTDTIDS